MDEFNQPVRCCDDCAFIEGTEAHRTEHTRLLAALCVDGLRPFYCHRRPGLCAGWVQAVNHEQAAGSYRDEQRRDGFAFMADVIADIIGDAARADEQASKRK